jgi:hypothetical protein
MTPRQSHWLEKLSVQVTVLLSLAAGYFLLYPLARPDDSQVAVAFLAAGGMDHTVAFAAGVLVMGAACGLLTAASRPCGTILVIAVGAGAVALRSPEFRTLLWLRQDHFVGLFLLLMVETLLLAAVLAAAILVSQWVRAGTGRVIPRLVWHPMQAGQPSHASHATGRLAGLGPWGRSLTSAGLALLLGLAALAVLLQSSRRGQVLFALLTSFAVAVWVAQRLLPAPHGLAYLLPPLVTGIVSYALALVVPYESQADAWNAVPLWARVLPLDWLTAGCGGAMLGCWIGQRMDENKLLDQLDEQQKGD